MSTCGRGNFRVGRVARLSTCRLFTAIFSSFFPPTIIYARRAAAHVYTVYDIPYRVIRCRRRRRCPVKRVLSCERQPSAVRAADHRFRSHALPVVYLIFFFLSARFRPPTFLFFFPFLSAPTSYVPSSNDGRQRQRRGGIDHRRRGGGDQVQDGRRNRQP